MADTNESQIGKLSMSGKDVDHSVRCNALAFNPQVGGYEVMIMSVCGPSTTLKSIQAALNSRYKITFQPDDIPGMRNYYKMYRANSPYRIYRHRMGYQTWHMLAVAQHDGLLTEASHQSLWRALQSDSITTPMLRQWVPYIHRRLTERSLLTPLRCYGCNAAILRASVEDLDRIVSAGIRGGDLRLENPV